MYNENHFTPDPSPVESPEDLKNTSEEDGTTQPQETSGKVSLNKDREIPPDPAPNANQYYYDSDHLEQTDGYYQKSNPTPPTPDPSSTNFATTSLVLGIASLVLCCCCCISIPLGALGIIFAILSKGPSSHLPSIAKTGLILSIVGVVLTFVLPVASIIMKVPYQDSEFFQNQLEYYMQDYMGSDYDEWMNEYKDIHSYEDRHHNDL